jgi:ABC-2 type transport system permease protein/lipopolysaccharide transport system permease protein
MFVQMRLALSDAGRAVGLWHVWAFMAWQDVISKYRRSILGPLWIAGGMVATSLASSVSWGAISGQPLRDFLPFAMGGILIWTHFIAILVSEAPDLFVAAQGSIRNSAFPFMFYVLRFTARSLIVFAHNLVVFWAVTVFVGNPHLPNWQILPGLFVLTLVVLALAPVVGMVSARFRDLRFMLPFLAQILFFLTPVFWHADTLVGPKTAFVTYNPFYYLLEIMRTPLLGHPVSGAVWGVALSILAGSVVLWFVSFSAARRRIAFWI